MADWHQGEIRDVGPRDGLQSEVAGPACPPRRAGDRARRSRRAATSRRPRSSRRRRCRRWRAATRSSAASRPDGSTVVGARAQRPRRRARPGRRRPAHHGHVSASDGYSRKNVGRSTDEAIASLAEIGTTVADRSGGSTSSMSCAFGSPFDDVDDPAPVAGSRRRCARQRARPPAHARRHHRHRDAAAHRGGRSTRSTRRARPDLGLHLHDTRGTALANALAAIELGDHPLRHRHRRPRRVAVRAGRGRQPRHRRPRAHARGSRPHHRHRPRRDPRHRPRSCPISSATPMPSRVSAAGPLPASTVSTVDMSKRRQELLAIAAELFAARGFANVTVDDIGDAAGVSGPALVPPLQRQGGAARRDAGRHQRVPARRRHARSSPTGGDDVLERLCGSTPSSPSTTGR